MTNLHPKEIPQIAIGTSLQVDPKEKRNVYFEDRHTDCTIRRMRSSPIASRQLRQYTSPIEGVSKSVERGRVGTYSVSAFESVLLIDLNESTGHPCARASESAFMNRTSFQSDSIAIKHKRRSWRPAIELLEQRLAPSVATINWTDVHQQIDGFGASSAWTMPTMTTAQANLFFSQTSGIGLSLLRSRIAPNGTTGEVSTMQLAQARARWSGARPWSPPAAWKTNNDVNNGGSLLPSHYQDYANQLANYVQNMQAQGINLYALSIQNEPDWTATYESCNWTASQFHDFVAVLGPTFCAAGLRPRSCCRRKAAGISNWPPTP